MLPPPPPPILYMGSFGRQGPVDWSPERLLMEAAQEEAEQAARAAQKSHREEEARRSTLPADYLAWIKSIPLAASAAQLNIPPPSNPEGEHHPPPPFKS